MINAVMIDPLLASGDAASHCGDSMGLMWPSTYSVVPCGDNRIDSLSFHEVSVERVGNEPLSADFPLINISVRDLVLSDIKTLKLNGVVITFDDDEIHVTPDKPMFLHNTNLEYQA